MQNRHSLQELRAKYILPVWEGFNHFICIPSFSLRVYLALAECKIEILFSS